MNIALSLSESLFAWCWATSVHVSLIMAIVFLLQKLSARWLTPGVRYGMSLLILIGLLMPIAPASSFSLRNLARTAFTVLPSASTPSLSSSSLGPDILKGESSITLTSHSLEDRLPRLSLLQIASLIWLSGLCGLVLIAIWRYGKWYRAIQRGQLITDQALLDLFEQTKRFMGVRRSIRLVSLEHLSSPAVFGLFRVQLVLPDGVWQRMNPGELRLIFLHELVHIKNGDALLNWLLITVQFLYWFNPLVWLALYRLRMDRELWCDARVLQQLEPNQYRDYGQVLIKLAEVFSTERPVLANAVPVVSSQYEITRRIIMIKSYHPPSALARSTKFLCVVALGGVTLTSAKELAKDRSNDAPTNAKSVASIHQPDPASANLVRAAITELKKDLENPSDEMRLGALDQFLSEYGHMTEAQNPILGEAVPILLAATKDQNRGVRWFAVSVLKNIQSTKPEALNVLCNLMRYGTDLNMATIAASTFKAMGPTAAKCVPSIMETLQQRRDDGTFISPADGVSERDRSGGTALQRAIIEALGNIGPAAIPAVPLLRERLQDQSSFSLGNRVFSAKALWQITGKTNEALPVLIKALTEEDSFWAADILALMGPAAKPAVPALRQVFQSHHGHTQSRAALALTKIAPQAPVSMPFFIKLLNNQNEDTRYEAAEFLWYRTHDPHMVLSTLLQLLELSLQPYESIPRPYGIKAIKLLGEIGPLAKDAIPNLKFLESGKNPQIRDLANAALKKIQTNTE